MNRHMRKVIGQQILSYEEFLTVINQIEAVLNARPLFPLSNDPNDPTAITPAHFLVGDTMLSLPQNETRDTNMNTRSRLIQKLHDDFWKSWKRDYLTELQIRQNGSPMVLSFSWATWY